MAMKTPGVYIVEKNAFPNSVVEVATAVPAFIGYTERADNGGNSLYGKPWRIASMAEYERYFGAAPAPKFKIKRLTAAAAAAAAADTAGAPAKEGLDAQMAEALTAASTDKPAPAATMDKPRTQVSEINRNGRKYLLMREPGKAGNRYLLHQAMRHFFQNGGGPCYIVSVGNYDTDIEAGDDAKGLVSGLVPLIKEQEPTMIVVPDAVLLPKADCVTVQTAALKHCGYDMKNRVAILDVWGGELDRQDPAGSCIDDFRNDIGINFLDYAAAYYPWLHTSLVQSSAFNYWMVDSAADLAAILWDDLGLSKAEAGDKRAAQHRAALADVTKTDADWIKVITDIIDGGSKTDEQKAKAKARLADAKLAKDDIAPHRILLDKSLLTTSELYTKIRDEALVQMNLMPPAAAMAGLYTMVDNTRGVWKAPANVSVAGVVKPAVEISHADQEDLNVTTQGKSINAIRSFIGEGALVWGARTLDGNSLDWRYINVRRTMIMLEESCRLAAKAMVFEPNVSTTWVTIKSMISNFLVGIWKRGGLAGAVPDDAFSVHVGLGETMTPEDILEGILRVTVLVAISRPAEFIEITFQQQMQKS